MLAALIALLLGGAAFALGGGGSTSSAAAERPDEDEDDLGPAPNPPAASVVAPGPAEDLPNEPDSAYTLNWGGLTDEEQMMVELINRARMDVSEEVARQGEGLASGISPADDTPLAVVPTLSEASRDHSENMDNRQFFDHEDPAGDEPWDRAQDAGHANGYVGENIAVIASFSTNFDEQARVEALHAGLWESDGHQRNMLRDDWTEIGVGYDYGSYRGNEGGTYVTTKFGDTGETYLTGVVIDDEDGDDFYDMGEGQGGVRITAIDENNPDNVFTTSTWDAGGYTLALPPGTYRVVFEGGDLDAPQEASVTIGNDNVKLDIIEEDGPAQAIASATLVATPVDAEAVLPMLPPVEEDAFSDDLEEDEPFEPVLF
ncbi:MAG: CAP domain-containing protein [Pseudomonadota bacterium]